MAITFLNQTICSLCQNELKNNEQIFSFPAFVPNTKDPVYQFNDSAVHLKCLKKHPLCDKAIQFEMEYILKTHPQNRICAIGGNVIQSYQDYIFIDLLTSNEEEALFEFNFTTLDKNNLKGWQELDLFIDLATKFQNEGKWGDLTSFRYLDNLIKVIGG